MADFSHLEPGTAESVWRSDGRLGKLPELDLGIDRLVVVAAHPDDETLGAAGLMSRVHRGGGQVTVIVATDGEGSHPASPTHSPARLATIRREEVRRAVGVVAPAAEVHFLLLPDSGLRERRAELRSGLMEILRAAVPAGAGEDFGTLVVAPWSGDGHRDHRITAQVVAELCGERGIRHLGYPIWLWHWGVPEQVPWSESRALSLTAEERAAKDLALAQHRTQIQPLSPQPGDEPILHSAMQEHFLRPHEVFVQDSITARTMPAEHFDAIYARHEDPWGFESRWYEQRKRDVLLASLPQRRLGRVLEIGCSTGLLTAELTLRADTVTAIDSVAAAITAARRRVPGDDVRFSIGRVPEDWPTGSFDTVVLSEIGYYFSAADLDRVIDRIDAGTEGCLVACHWRHLVPEYPQTGDAVHRALRAMPGWETTVLHVERDFVLEVFERSPARSVAELEGLA